MSKRENTCPICGDDSATAAENRLFPFCSERCQLVDLGRWLDGDYRIETPSSPSGLDGDDEGYM